ncbi:MAG: bile acid:sodium symporter family protein [Planctomycetaceae bacterium]
MFQRYLILWLIASSLFSLKWPDWFGDAVDPFALSKLYLSYLITLTMFCVGCLLPPDELKQVFRRWPTIVFGTCVQYLSMPALAYSMAILFDLDRADKIGVIIVGVVPGAMASNVLTMTARGNVSYSVSLTTLATLLSPIVVPLGLWLLLGADLPMPPGDVAWKLFLEVVLPVMCGYAICRLWSDFERLSLKFAPAIANGIILWIIAVVVALNRDRITEISSKTLLALLLVNVLGYLAGYYAAGAIRLPRKMRRTLSIEVGMQNAGLGTSLAISLFPDLPGATIPTATYTFGCMLTATILAWYWSLRDPEDPVADGAQVKSTRGSE